MLVSSRSFEEYVAFFDLTTADLARRLLDCSAGAADLVATVGDRGGSAIAVDPGYADPAALRAQVAAGWRDGARILDEHNDRFEWSWYGSPDRRAVLRRRAAQHFLADLRLHPERYVAGALPSLPFEDSAFDLALCSHLLFTWADVFDRTWHRQAIDELLRVAGEVRIYPMVLQGDGAPPSFLDALIDELEGTGRRVELRPVPYRFQRGADRMLVLAT